MSLLTKKYECPKPIHISNEWGLGMMEHIVIDHRFSECLLLVGLRPTQELRRRQQQCLADLNAQMAAKAALAAAEADAKRQERAAIAAEVARNEAEQQRLAAERRAAMSSVKFDRQRQVHSLLLWMSMCSDRG